MSRLIDTIIYHCSASDLPEHDNIKTITEWHLKRGFITCGYHYFIRKDGTVEEGRPLNKIGAHTLGHNLGSIGICLSGDKHFTEEQFLSLAKLTKDLQSKFKLPNSIIFGHNHFTKFKTCPNFNVDLFKSKYLK